MPQLEQNAPAFRVHRVGHECPPTHLVFRPDARRIGIAHAHRIDGRRLADDQPGRSALAVVFRHQRIGRPGHTRPCPGQRCHDDTVRQRDRAGLQRSERGFIMGLNGWSGLARVKRAAAAG